MSAPQHDCTLEGCPFKLPMPTPTPSEAMPIKALRRLSQDEAIALISELVGALEEIEDAIFRGSNGDYILAHARAALAKVPR